VTPVLYQPMGVPFILRVLHNNGGSVFAPSASPMLILKDCANTGELIHLNHNP
jgi:hypothetical protein